MHLSTRTTVSFVIMVTLVATFMLVPATSEAAGPLGFEIEGEGSTPWSFGGIMPGDKGTVPVTLINNGATEAWATIWVSSIVETDHANDGAWLAHYMLFGMRSTHLYTDMVMPANVYDLPNTPDESTLFIGPIAPGAAVELYWEWEFFDNNRPQDEAQGDGLRFDINYQLRSSPPGVLASITFDILGKNTVAPIDVTGAVARDVIATSSNGEVRLHIEKGTRIVSDDGARPTLVELHPVISNDISSLPRNFMRFGDVYELVATADGADIDIRLNGNVTLTVRLDPFTLPEGTRSITLFENVDGNWTRVEGRNTNSWEAWGRLSTFGRYAVGISSNAEPGVPFFTVLNATATPMAENYWFWPFIFFKITGESARAEVHVINVGDTGGTCVIEAEINGRLVASQAKTLEAGENALVTLRVDDILGRDNGLIIAGQSFSMSRSVWINWPLIVLMIATVAAAVYAGYRYAEREDGQQ